MTIRYNGCARYQRLTAIYSLQYSLRFHLLVHSNRDLVFGCHPKNSRFITELNLKYGN